MRLKAVSAPHALDETSTDADVFLQPAEGPVGDLGRWIGSRECHDARGDLRPKRRNARGSRLVAQKAVVNFLHEALLPAPDIGDLPVSRMIPLVPIPLALNSTISARQRYFCGALRSR